MSKDILERAVAKGERLLAESTEGAWVPLWVVSLHPLLPLLVQQWRAEAEYRFEDNMHAGLVALASAFLEAGGN